MQLLLFSFLKLCLPQLMPKMDHSYRLSHTQKHKGVIHKGSSVPSLSLTLLYTVHERSLMIPSRPNFPTDPQLTGIKTPPARLRPFLQRQRQRREELAARKSCDMISVTRKRKKEQHMKARDEEAADARERSGHEDQHDEEETHPFRLPPHLVRPPR